jgi:PAS domain S-box-containing protein
MTGVTFGAAFGTGLVLMLFTGQMTVGLFLILLLMTLLFTAAAGLVSHLMMRRLLLPMGRLSDAAARLATGDLSTTIPIWGSLEIRKLAKTLETARHEIEGITRWLTHEKAWAEYLVDSISEGILTLDAQNRITYISKTAASLLGTKVEEARTKPLNDLLIPADTDGHFTEMLPATGTEQTYSVMRADGRTVTLSVTAAALKPPVESTARTALVLRDVTSETAIQKLQSYFLGNLSHELQTPLASLRTSAELLVTEHDDLTEDDHHKLHTAIYRGILRLEALIDNLLASASVQAGNFKVKPTTIDLGEPIEDAMLFMGPLMDAAGIALAIDLPDRLPMVHADSRRITQVFVNLLSNAVKFTPSGSTVHLTAAMQGDEQLRVNVSDEGAGIPAESRDLIFSRFARLDSPGARKDHGAGLGLYIARTIVESHGGAIGVEPAAEKGTTFWFTLPVEESAQPANTPVAKTK